MRGMVVAPLSNFRAKTVGPAEKFFMDRCPKEEPAAKNLVWNKSSTYSREKLEKPVEGPPWLAIGGLIVPGELT